ncbi:MAG: DUF1080 domain-containing protein [Verrucomicrobiales bacterium]|nr:DUF1080 domain-containing protein [Verrucomicrobiales bacterium]
MLNLIKKWNVLAVLTTLIALGNLSAEEGFVDLFNGKDLSGWTISEEHPDSYSVKDGVLIVKGGRSHIFYTGEVSDGNFKNFELKVRAKTFPGANSGVYFHTKYQKEGWPDNGYECQVNSTHKDPKKTGSLYGVKNIIVLKEGQKEPKGDNAVREEAPSTDGEWFDYHIKVVDKRITIKVNGEITVDYEEPAEGSGTNFKGRKVSGGTFAIQAHDPDSEVHYESIQVKVLP